MGGGLVSARRRGDFSGTEERNKERVGADADVGL